MRIKHGAGFRINDRANIGKGIRRIANGQCIHGTGKSLDQMVGRFLRCEQNAQRRAALACRAKGGQHNVINDLFHKRGCVDKHAIQAAGFGDQRHDWPILRSERAVDDAGHFGGSGKGHPGNVREVDQRRTNAAIARQKVEDTLGQACLQINLHRFGGDQRALLGRFGEDRITGSKRGC